MNRYAKQVLVPTDFSEESFAALEYAVFYANRTDSGIHLIHVANREMLRKQGGDVRTYRALLQDIRQQLRTFRNRSGGAFRIHADYKLSEDSVAQTILNYAANFEIELCCIGTSGERSAGHRGGLGLNTGRMINEAGFPILTCRSHPEKIHFRNILLPIDLTRQKKKKVDRIIRFAMRFNSTVYLLAVSEFMEEFSFSRKSLLEKLESAALHIRSQGIKCHTEIIRYDTVSRSVVEYASEIRADLLVVMSEPQSLVTELIFGNRTSKVIAQSPIPVISFRPVH